MTRLKRGWARRAARTAVTFAVVATLTALPFVAFADVFWSR